MNDLVFLLLAVIALTALMLALDAGWRRAAHWARPLTGDGLVNLETGEVTFRWEDDPRA